MSQSLTTSTLLDGLLTGSQDDAWLQFDQRYRPILEAFGRRLGLSDHDAADIGQETVTRFVQEYLAGRYDRTRGRLRTWLIAIARARIADHYRERARRSDWRGDSVIQDLPDEESLSDLWESERRQEVLRQAILELRETSRLTDRTIAAFQRSAIQGEPVQVVADSLGLTAHDVYMAKNRVAEKLREVLERYDLD